MRGELQNGNATERGREPPLATRCRNRDRDVMGRRLTERQLELRAAEARLKAERAALKQQQQRVAAARRQLDRLSRCDLCGVRTIATGEQRQLCLECTRDQIAARKAARLLALGFGRDGRKLPPEPAAA